MGYSFNPQKKRLEICKALSCRTIEIACLVNVGVTNRSCRESLRYRNYVPIINFVAMIQFDSFFFWNFLIHKTLELKYRLPKTNLAVFPLQMNQILIPELKPCCFKWFWWNKGTHPTPHSAWSWKFDSKHPSSKRNQRLVSLASWVDVHSTKTWKMTYENHLTMKVVYIWYLQPIKGSFYLYIYISWGWRPLNHQPTNWHPENHGFSNRLMTLGAKKKHFSIFRRVEFFLHQKLSDFLAQSF